MGYACLFTTQSSLKYYSFSFTSLWIHVTDADTETEEAVDLITYESTNVSKPIDRYEINQCTLYNIYIINIVKAR